MRRWRHGTRYAHKVKRCRCDACRAAVREVNRRATAKYRLLHPEWTRAMYRRRDQRRDALNPGAKVARLEALHERRTFFYIEGNGWTEARMAR